MEYIQYPLVGFLLVCGFLVAFSRSSVDSVLFLILTFCNAAAILFLFNAEFLGLLFIIIYVGAIAVLFLFVVMMLNIKNKEGGAKFLRASSILNIIIIYITIVLIFLFLSKLVSSELSSLSPSLNSFNFFLDSLYNIDILGQSLYNYFICCFLVAGLILLVALVGAVVLVFGFKNFKHGQIVERQLSRCADFITFYA